VGNPTGRQDNRPDPMDMYSARAAGSQQEQRLEQQQD
jgi:hypothetical protein